MPVMFFWCESSRAWLLLAVLHLNEVIGPPVPDEQIRHSITYIGKRLHRRAVFSERIDNRSVIGISASSLPHPTNPRTAHASSTTGNASQQNAEMTAITMNAGVKMLIIHSGIIAPSYSLNSPSSRLTLLNLRVHRDT